MMRLRHTVPAMSPRAMHSLSSISNTLLLTRTAATATNESQTEEQNDLVRLSVQKLLSVHKAIPQSPHSDNKTLQTLQHQLQDARSCVQDCQDCLSNPEQFQAELQTANRALDKAVLLFVDLLDEMPAGAYPAREKEAALIKDLRQQLQALQQKQQEEK